MYLIIAYYLFIFSPLWGKYCFMKIKTVYSLVKQVPPIVLFQTICFGMVHIYLSFRLGAVPFKYVGIYSFGECYMGQLFFFIVARLLGAGIIEISFLLVRALCPVHHRNHWIFKHKPPKTLELAKNMVKKLPFFLLFGSLIGWY